MIDTRKNLTVKYKTVTGHTGTVNYDFLAADISHGVTLKEHLLKSVQNHLNQFRDKDKAINVVDVEF